MARLCVTGWRSTHGGRVRDENKSVLCVTERKRAIYYNTGYNKKTAYKNAEASTSRHLWLPSRSTQGDRRAVERFSAMTIIVLCTLCRACVGGTVGEQGGEEDEYDVDCEEVEESALAHGQDEAGEEGEVGVEAEAVVDDTFCLRRRRIAPIL